MTSPAGPDGCRFADGTSFADLALGDIVQLPDGRSLSVRAMAQLTAPVGSMAGFVLLGELEVLLSVPSSGDVPVNAYFPVSRFPAEVAQARPADEGAARYWAPHLPPVDGAMGEIRYRIVELRGSADPVVALLRGPEAVVFVRATYLWARQLAVLYMGRGHLP